MTEKVEATDKKRDRHIKTDMQEMKQRYETVNEKLWNLETRMDTMSRDQAEKLETDRPQGTRVEFKEPQRNKRESTPLPRIAASTGAEGQKPS